MTATASQTRAHANLERADAITHGIDVVVLLEGLDKCGWMLRAQTR